MSAMSRCGLPDNHEPHWIRQPPPGFLGGIMCTGEADHSAADFFAQFDLTEKPVVDLRAALEALADEMSTRPKFPGTMPGVRLNEGRRWAARIRELLATDAARNIQPTQEAL